MLKVDDLEKYFEEAQSNEFAFQGKCHDCKCDVTVDVDMDKNGMVTIAGGAVYGPDMGIGGEKKIFLKCDRCFEKDPILRNYQPCEVFSRVVGYLRPVAMWNKGKQAEFGVRKNFDPSKEIA
jgi:hypothetical protein